MTVRVTGATPGQSRRAEPGIWDPGWTVNGVNAINFHDTAAAVIEVPSQVFLFRYRPRWWWVSLLLFALTTVGIAAVFRARRWFAAIHAAMHRTNRNELPGYRAPRAARTKPMTIETPDRARTDDWDTHWREYVSANALNPASVYRTRLRLRPSGAPRSAKPRAPPRHGLWPGRAREAPVLRGRPDAEVLGLDLSKTGVAIAQKKVPRARFFQQDLTQPVGIEPAYDGWATHAVCSRGPHAAPRQSRGDHPQRAPADGSWLPTGRHRARRADDMRRFG